MVKVPNVLKKWRKSSTTQRTLVLIYDENLLVRAEDHAFSNVGEDPRAALEQLWEDGDYNGLEVHYQGKQALYLFPEREGIQRYLCDRLPPGRELAEYHLAFQGRTVGLLPQTVLEPFFAFAADKGIAHCRLACMPGDQEGQHLIDLGDHTWLLEVNGGLVRRLVPLPQDRSHSLQKVTATTTREFALVPFPEPLFEWVDPAGKQRLAQQGNRRFLRIAALICSLILVLAGAGLFIARSHYETELLNLALAEGNLQARRREYLALHENLQTVIKEIETHMAETVPNAGIAIQARQILNLFPKEIRLEEMVYSRTLTGGPAWIISGFATDPVNATQLLSSLQGAFPKLDCFIAELDHLDPKQARYREARLGSMVYSFRLVMEAPL